MTAFGPVRIATESSRPAQLTVARQAERRPAHPLLGLQRSVGNNVVARLVAQREGPEEDEMMAKHDRAADESGEMEEEELMAKHDTAQREAESGEMEEEELMARHDTAQREAESGEMEEEEMMAKHDPLARSADDDVMASADPAAPRVGLEGGPVGGDIESRINAQRGGGSTLESSFRTQMESHSGVALDSVRVHTGPESDALNRSISAKAFTTGSDIFLRNDVTPSDHSTMAHEVGHVLQQRSMDGLAGDGMTVGAADSAYEHEADDFAQSALVAPPQERREEA